MGKKSVNHLIRQNENTDLITEQVTAFLSDRRARRLSPGTLDYYSYYLAILLRYCQDRALVGMEDLTPPALREVFDHFGQDHNPGGVRALFSSTRAMCCWYEKENDDDGWHNPFRKLQAPKIKDDPIPGVSVDDVKRLVDTCGKDWYSRRDRALLLFLFDTGLRASECLNLNLEHIDLESGTVQVFNGKGNKDRVVFFGSETAGALRRYLRGRSGEAKTSPLWLNKFGERIDRPCLRDMITRRSTTAGLNEVPSAHDFRRGFALNMLRNGADLLTVSRLLGHESLEVTKRYLALVEDDLKRAHDYASPVDGMKKKGK